MESDLRILEQLRPEQVVERAEALRHELAYWQHVIDDQATINDGTRDVVTAVLEGSTSALTLLLTASPEQVPVVQTILDQHREALEAVKRIVAALEGTAELADGRQKALRPVARALRRAAGLDPDDGEPGEQ